MSWKKYTKANPKAARRKHSPRQERVGKRTRIYLIIKNKNQEADGRAWTRRKGPTLCQAAALTSRTGKKDLPIRSKKS